MIKRWRLLTAFMLTGFASCSKDANFHIYLYFGQSNMEGHGKIELQDTIVDNRFMVLEAVDCPNLGRKKKIMSTKKNYPVVLQMGSNIPNFKLFLS